MWDVIWNLCRWQGDRWDADRHYNEIMAYYAEIPSLDLAGLSFRVGIKYYLLVIRNAHINQMMAILHEKSPKDLAGCSNGWTISSNTIVFSSGHILSHKYHNHIFHIKKIMLKWTYKNHSHTRTHTHTCRLSAKCIQSSRYPWNGSNPET